MKNKSGLFWSTCLIGLLALSSLACRLGSSPERSQSEPTARPGDTVTSDGDVPASASAGNADTSPTPQPTSAAPPRPTDPPPPTDTPQPEPTSPPKSKSFDAAQVNSLDTVNSYRLLIDAEFTGVGEDGSPFDGTLSGEVVAVKEPPAQSISFHIAGIDDPTIEGDEINFEVAQFEDTMQMSMPGFGCFSGAPDELGDPTEEFSMLVDPDEFLVDVEGVEYSDVETIGGYESDCYIYDKTSFKDDNGNIENASGKICISHEFSHIVYLQVEGEGEGVFSNDTDDGAPSPESIYLEMTVIDINQPLKIEPLASCAQEAESAYPLMPDARDVNQFGDFVSYISDASLEDILEFYEEALPALGYLPTGDQFTTNSTAITTYADETKRVNLTIAPVDEEDLSLGMQVLLFGGEGDE